MSTSAAGEHHDLFHAELPPLVLAFHRRRVHDAPLHVGAQLLAARVERLRGGLGQRPTKAATVVRRREEGGSDD